ncbi:MAG TPA: type II secretion system protein [Candidatus Acidoferrum sp.]|nr:type II secretion system protein [Candidatus Acidoferrum sp.]
MTQTQTFRGPPCHVRVKRQWRTSSSPQPKIAVRRRRARGAFTLTELLVVIAVIGILAALLLPVLSGTKLRALQTQCLGNLRQFTLAHTLYIGDYNATCLDYDFTGKNNLWMGRLVDYQPALDALRKCPAAKDPNPASFLGTADKTWYYDSREPAKRWYGSYLLNGWLYSSLTNQFGGMPVVDQDKIFQKESNILLPSTTPVFSDGIFVDSWPRTNDTPPDNLYLGETAARRFNAGLGRMLIDRHGGIPAAKAPTNVDPTQKLPGAINVACADGHVELAKLENLWNFYWNQTWTPPHPRPR